MLVYTLIFRHLLNLYIIISVNSFVINDWEEQDAKQQYEILTGKGIPVIVMEPLRGGTLTVLEGEAASLLRKANPSASQASWGLRFAVSLPGVRTQRHVGA